jgi:hypothetical protein
LLLNISKCGFLEEVGDHGSSHDLPSAPPSAALLSSFLKCDSNWSKPELLCDSESLRLTGKLVSMKRRELQTSIWPSILNLLLLRLYDYGCSAVGIAVAEPSGRPDGRWAAACPNSGRPIEVWNDRPL